eukprot:766073-Hanusia_phi.AAC.4
MVALAVMSNEEVSAVVNSCDGDADRACKVRDAVLGCCRGFLLASQAIYERKESVTSAASAKP